MQKELEQLTANEIVFPKEIRPMVEGRDSVVLNPVYVATRLVVWVDSLACSTCHVNKMFEYSEIINFHKEIGDELVPVFLFSPPRTKINEVLITLKSLEFEYPVFIDENQAFPAANPHIPTDHRFHTFLLDKNGKVVLVGDPANNPQLWELYKSTITELIANGGVMPDVEKKE